MDPGDGMQICRPAMRTKHTFRLPPDLAGQLADYADRKRVPQALVVETALASYLSPDNSERLEAALGRRLDRLTRQVERLERHVTISNEALALFVRFWLTSHAAAAGYGAAGRPGQRPRALRGICRGARAAAGERAEPRPTRVSQDVDSTKDGAQTEPIRSYQAIPPSPCLSTPEHYACI